VSAFRDTSPVHWSREPTREECAQADEQYWNDQAAQRGGECFDLTDAIAGYLDKRMCEWRADQQETLDAIHALLTQVKALAETL
jgi:hypothetical protein